MRIVLIAAVALLANSLGRPAQAQGWRVFDTRDPIDDRRVLTALKTSAEHPGAWLQLGCVKGEWAAIVRYPGYVGRGERRVLVRFDQAPPSELDWRALGSGFAPVSDIGARHLIARAARSRRLVFRVGSAPGPFETYTFDLSAIAAPLGRLRAACPPLAP